MWQTVSRKAHFIGQLMKGRLDVREVDDIGEAALDAAQVAAVVSGDSRLLLRAQLDAKVQKLHRLSRAHERSQASLRADVTTLTDTIAGHRSQLTWARQHADQAAHTTDPGVVKVTAAPNRFPDPVTDRGQAAELLQQQLIGYVARGESERRVVLEIGDNAFTALPHRSAEGVGVVIAPMGMEDSDLRTVVPPTTLHPSASTERKLGLLSRVENLHARIPDQPARLERGLTELEHRLTQTRQRLGTPFKRAAELSEARQQLGRINAELAGQLDQAAQQAAAASTPSTPTGSPGPEVGARTTDPNSDETTRPPRHHNLSYGPGHDGSSR